VQIAVLATTVYTTRESLADCTFSAGCMFIFHLNVSIDTFLHYYLIGLCNWQLICSLWGRNICISVWWTSFLKVFNGEATWKRSVVVHYSLPPYSLLGPVSDTMKQLWRLSEFLKVSFGPDATRQSHSSDEEYCGQTDRHSASRVSKVWGAFCGVCLQGHVLMLKRWLLGRISLEPIHWVSVKFNPTDRAESPTVARVPVTRILRHKTQLHVHFVQAVWPIGTEH
jgi:hypothetical protein